MRGLRPTSEPIGSVDVSALTGEEPANRWGSFAAIDLHGCNEDRLRSSQTIRDFFEAVVPGIGMEAHGDLQLARFGQGDLEGWSAMQFIKTSTVVLHADEAGCRCFIDIFSCKVFLPEVAAQIAVRHFEGQHVVRTLGR